ncbi:MAG: hypothetical protein JO097_02615, partial [Acidobacteriaceae bacterium]|nr:hypothetical protein [Acidobacteriaceae bacterium]MBV9294976.1 hypothetical protein [Acidobacteriaceae bacterium]
MDRSLAGYLGDGPADSSILPIFRRTLEALHSIHGAGGSHLPLSPATIRFDDAGEPQIRSSPRLHESADTVAFGSAKYSAPDAFTRTESTSCESADCYVLGFIFYEILVGKRWFEAQFGSLENGPSALWLKWHADRTANARPVIELRPNLGDFARLIDGMMEKDPRKRINSISQVLAGFANFEAQTTYKTDPGSRAATPSKSRELYELVRSKATLTGAWLAKRVSAIRKLRLSAVKIVLSAAAIGVTAMLFYREIPLHHVPHPAPAATAPALPRIPLPTERAKPVLQIPPLPDRGTIPPAPAPAPDTATLPSPPAPEPESELQIESRLNSRTLLLLDDLRPVTVSPGSMFSEKIKPGTHKLKLLTRSNSFVQLPLDVNDEGILVLKRPTARSLRYVMIASSGKSAKLYASPEARVGLRGEVYEPIPAEGMSIANDSAVTVLLNEDSKSQVRLNPLPARSIRIVLEPNALRPLTTVEINANVPDAGIIVNGEKLARSLENGVTVLHLRPGEYHVKLVHP